MHFASAICRVTAEGSKVEVATHTIRGSKMAKVVHVEGFDAFKQAAEANEGSTVYALFSGSIGDDGVSWCPDCVVADPIINEAVKSLSSDAVFIHCSVGDRAFWKDQSNVFRTDSQLRLKSVPSLLCLGQPKRLEEAKCADKNLVQMFFED